MANKKISFIVYYYMYTKAAQHFGINRNVSRTEFTKYISNSFNLDRKIRNRAIQDMIDLGLASYINRDVLKLNAEKMLTYLSVD